MLVLGVAALAALVVGGVVALIAWRWPRVDPTSPEGRSLWSDATGHDVETDAEGVTVLGLSAAACAVAVSLTLLGLLFLAVRTRTGAAGVDLGLAGWAADHEDPAATSVLRVLTYLGSAAVVLPLAVVVGVVEARRLPNRSIPVFLLLVEGGQLLLVNLIKVLVGRSRPDINQLVEVADLSFPSGHVTNAAATFAALALLVGRRRRRTVRVALAGGAAGVTALVASTRVFLGVHWVTDVLAGAALGWGWAALCSVAYGGRRLRFGSPLAKPATPGTAARDRIN